MKYVYTISNLSEAGLYENEYKAVKKGLHNEQFQSLAAPISTTPHSFYNRLTINPTGDIKESFLEGLDSQNTILYDKSTGIEREVRVDFSEKNRGTRAWTSERQRFIQDNYQIPDLGYSLNSRCQDYLNTFLSENFCYKTKQGDTTTLNSLDYPGTVFRSHEFLRDTATGDITRVDKQVHFYARFTDSFGAQKALVRSFNDELIVLDAKYIDAIEQTQADNYIYAKQKEFNLYVGDRSLYIKPLIDAVSKVKASPNGSIAHEFNCDTTLDYTGVRYSNLQVLGTAFVDKKPSMLQRVRERFKKRDKELGNNSSSPSEPFTRTPATSVGAGSDSGSSSSRASTPTQVGPSPSKGSLGKQSKSHLSPAATPRVTFATPGTVRNDPFGASSSSQNSPGTDNASTSYSPSEPSDMFDFKNATHLQGLLPFSEKAYASENVRFLLDVLEFKRLIALSVKEPGSKAYDESVSVYHQIVNEYIHSSIPNKPPAQEINIDNQTKNKLLANYNDSTDINGETIPRMDLFDEAVKIIEIMVKGNDFYAKYLNRTPTFSASLTPSPPSSASPLQTRPKGILTRFKNSAGNVVKTAAPIPQAASSEAVLDIIKSSKPKH